MTGMRGSTNTKALGWIYCLTSTKLLDVHHHDLLDGA
jgi:hypothetical protein